jgi:hypothetical protein
MIDKSSMRCWPAPGGHARSGPLRPSAIDRLRQALGWATANEKTFGRIVEMSIRESGLGDPEGRHSKRNKIIGVLRDVLREKSTGIIEEIPHKGIVKYAKPAGVIASLVPTYQPGTHSRPTPDSMP